MNLDAADIVLRLVGAFYAFAGYAGTRAGLMSHLLDVALAGITLKQPPRVEVLRAAWLIGASTLVLAGGLALMLLLDWAAWLFLASAVGQLAYLTIAAPYYFDREDPPDAGGRQQTLNAFILYAAATAFVVWAYTSGKLQAWVEVNPLALAAATLALLAHAAYVARSLVMPRKPAFSGGGDDVSYEPDPEIPPERLAQANRVQVMAEFECHPLWALDDGLSGNFPPELLGLSAELTRDLNDWAAAYQSSFGDPAHTPWTQEQRKAHDDMGRRLAERLATERPHLSVCIMDDTGFVDILPTKNPPG